MRDESFGDRPEREEFLRFAGPTAVIDQGPWREEKFPGARLAAVIFDDLSIELEAGTYWVSPLSVTNYPEFGTGFWGTANTGDPNGSQAWTRWSYDNYWQPIESYFNVETEGAMRIEGTVVPGPAVIPAVGVLAGVGSRRRRSRR